MSGKLLNEISEENQDLQRRVGCMMGIFQMLDRHRLLSGRRLSRKRLPAGGGAAAGDHLRAEEHHQASPRIVLEKKDLSRSLNENQRVSVESSRASFTSSSCSSSLSSLECSRGSTATVPPPAASPRRQSLGFRDVVKEAMNRDGGGPSAIKTSSSRSEGRTKQQHQDSPRPSLPSPRSFLEDRGGPARRSSYQREAARASLDSREQQSRFSMRLQELPRLSLDSKQGSLKNSNKDSRSYSLMKDLEAMEAAAAAAGGRKTHRRPASVVAKLMGLEEMTPLGSSDLQATSPSLLPLVGRKMPEESKQERPAGACPDLSLRASSSSSSSSVPRMRSGEPAIKPTPSSRIPIEPAPWKQQQGKQTAHRRQPQESIYSEIERKLKVPGFQQSNKDFRALERILEAIQANGLLESKRREKLSGGPSMAASDQNLRRTAGVQNPQTRQLIGSFSSEAPPIVIMKPARSIHRSHIPSSSIIPLGGLASLRRVHTGGSATENTENRRCSDEEGNSSQRARVQASHGSPRSPQLTKENSRGGAVKSSGSLSPRLQQLRKLEQEKKSEPTKPRKQQPTTRRASESVSPRARARPKMAGLAQQNDEQLSEISVNNLSHRPLAGETSLRRTESNGRLEASSPGREASSAGRCAELASILIQREIRSPPEKDVHEDVPTSRLEQPSPVSVLDASFYKDDLPASPIKKALNSSREDPQSDHHVPGRGIWKPAGPDSRHLPNNPTSDSSSPAYHKTIKSIDSLLQKLWWLTLSNDDDEDENSPAAAASSLIDVKNPNHQYVYEMLMASGLLGTGSDDGPVLPTRLHKSGCVMDPGLFLLLEQRHRSKSQGEKLRRRLLFDAVNEMLARKVESAGLVQSRPVHGRAQLLKELCTEIDRLTAHRGGGGGGGAASFDDEEDDALKPIVSEHMMQQSEGWADFGKEASGLVLDIERSIFKDLIGELVNGEMAIALSLPGRLSKHHSRLPFR